VLLRPELRHFHPTLWRGIWVFLALLAVLVLERRGAFRKPVRPLKLLGDASYSLYLWHYPLLILLVPALRAVGISNFSALLALAIGASIAFGLLCYWFIERPLIDLLRLRRHAKGIRIPAGP
jgi:exopolysaccharide production protein ExoZ